MKASSGGQGQEPALAYVRSGLRATEPSGGFILTWISVTRSAEQTVIVERIYDLGTGVKLGEPAILASGSGLEAPLLLTSEGRSLLSIYLDKGVGNETDKFVMTPLVCGQP